MLSAVKERLYIGHLDQVRAKRLRRYADTRFYRRLAVTPHDVLHQTQQWTNLVALKRRFDSCSPYTNILVRNHAQEMNECVQCMQRLFNWRSRDVPTVRGYSQQIRDKTQQNIIGN